MQKSLLGMIYPAIRAISLGVDGLDKLKVIMYLDRKPEEADYEMIQEVTSEVCADINFQQVEELCIFSDLPLSQLDHLTAWVYIRKE